MGGTDYQHSTKPARKNCVPLQFRHAPLVLALGTVKQDLEVCILPLKPLHGVERWSLCELALQLCNLSLEL